MYKPFILKGFKSNLLFKFNGLCFINYLYKDEKSNTSYVTDDKKGKKSILEYKLINTKNNLSLVKINLLTGRHHQIRVQFSSRGHSLSGDGKYGTRGRGKGLALWAYSLTFEHPTKKEEMVFEKYPEITGSWKILEDKE